MKINDDVLAVLSTSRVEGNLVTLPGQLDRKLYLRVNEVLEAMGGTWNRKRKGHVFDGDDPVERIDDVLLTGEVERMKDVGFFPTPDRLAADIVRKAHIEYGDEVLEPSAGHGALVRQIGNIIDRAFSVSITCVELVERNVAALRRIQGTWPHATCASIVVVQADFLTWDPGRTFDRVVMNPTFRRQADIDHVLHAYSLLRPGGRLVSIMSAGVQFRGDRKTLAFRELVTREGAIEPLPNDSFAESGTNVRTCVVTMTKNGISGRRGKERR